MTAFDFVFLRAPLHSLKYAFEQPHIEGNDEFTSALLVAAPDFYSELQKIDTLPEKKRDKLLKSLLKYWLRSCVRCTPYGIFAGTSIMSIQPANTKIILCDKSKHILNSRLDMDYLNFIKELLENDSNVRNQIRFLPNNSLYETLVDFRFAESYLKDTFKFYKLSSVENSEYIAYILDFAKDRKTLDELKVALNKKYPELAQEETAKFILEMWQSQLLISELELNITGDDPLQVLINI